MDIHLVILLMGVACVSDSSASTTESSIGITVATPTKEPEFHIHLNHLSSSTSSITVEWYIPPTFEENIEDYLIEARKLESEAILTSPSLPSNETLYEIEDLATNSKYEICLQANFKPGMEIDGENHKVCNEMYTLALIRKDSIVALCIAIGYILLMVIIGIVCWMCAQKKSREGDAAQDDQAEEEELLTEKAGNNYLAPPPQSRPRSSIEEELPNIPYITPPLEELARERDGIPVRRTNSGAATNI